MQAMSYLVALAAVVALALGAPTVNGDVAAPPAGKWFDRVLIMMFENHAGALPDDMQ